MSKRTKKNKGFKRRKPNTDGRFNQIFSDPAFKEIPKRDRDPKKITIDPRFKEMLTNPEFQPKLRYDKYGGKVGKQYHKSLKEYYEIEDDIDLNNNNNNNNHSKPNEKTNKLSKNQRKILRKIKKDDEKELNWDNVFNKDMHDKEYNEKKSLLNRKPGEMFDYTPETSDDSDDNDSNNESDNKEWKYEDYNKDDVGEDVRAILEDKNNETLTDPTKRIAIINMDWDNIRASDIYMVLRSFLPYEGSITKISIHPSEYGVKQMKTELINGPSKDIWLKGKLDGNVDEFDKYADLIAENEENTVMDSDNDNRDKHKEQDLLTQQIHSKLNEINKLEESITKIQNGKEGDILEDINEDIYNKQMLRKYELQKLKYYYCVVECDTINTADRLYQECDGREFMSTCNVFNMSFMPDEFVIPYEAKDICESLPNNYEPASNVTTNALGSTFVDLTWEKNDPNRIEQIKRSFNDDDINQMNLDDYLESDGMLTDAGFNTDVPVTDYETDTPNKKVKVKRKARKRYQDILDDFKNMESQIMGEDTNKNTKDTTKAKVDANNDANDIDKLIDALTSDESESNNNSDNNINVNKEFTIEMNEQTEKLHDWIKQQKIAKGLKNNDDNEYDGDSDDEDDPDDDDEPLVKENEKIPEEYIHDEYFKNIHDSTYMTDNMPPKKKRKMSSMDNNNKVEESDDESKDKMRAKLELIMMDKDSTDKYDPENNEINRKQFNKELHKRIKRSWKLRWLIKKAVKKKLNEMDGFKFDYNDERFNSIQNNPDFNIDPNNKLYKKTYVMNELMKQNRKNRIKYANKWNRNKNKNNNNNHNNNSEYGKPKDMKTVIENLKFNTKTIPEIQDTQSKKKDILKKLRSI